MGAAPATRREGQMIKHPDGFGEADAHFVSVIDGAAQLPRCALNLSTRRLTVPGLSAAMARQPEVAHGHPDPS